MQRGQVVDLVGLVGYQDGAVVSRTLVERRAGTVTLFAFDAGQALSEHTAPFDAWVHVLEGELELTLGGEPHTLAQGHAVTMPADVPHALRAVTRLKVLLVMIRG